LVQRAALLALSTLLSCLLVPPFAAASGSGSFALTGSTSAPLAEAAAAPLGDGRVLAAGGVYGGYFSGAEVFNPTSGTWGAVSPMSTPRADPVAARLPDGRVLVAGGDYYSGGQVYLKSAEAYNPVANIWTSLSDMGTPREAAVAAPLGDGRVLVAGGFYDDGSPHLLKSAEIYNPASNLWAPVASMSTPREFAVAAPLPGGRVLVAGGIGTGGVPLGSAEVYDPAGNAWTGVGGMSTVRSLAVAAPLGDGRVLVAGGSDPSTSLNGFSSAEVFNPSTNSFSSTGIGAMTTARLAAVAAPLSDGRALVAGGVARQGGPVLSSAEIFAATNTFSFSVKGRQLTLGVQAGGSVSVSDAAAPLKAAKKKRRLLLKPSSATGDPPTITVTLRLSKLAKQRLRQAGKVTVRARITFTPQGGVANTRTAKLRIRSKKK